MLKKITSLFIVLICMLTVLVPAVSAEQYYYDNKWNSHKEKVKLYYEDKQVFTDVPPLIINGRTLVPVRAFFERIGADVLWDASKQMVTVKSGSYKVTLFINKFEADVNGKKIIMDVPAKIITDSEGVGRTLVPVRFIGTQLGYEIGWDEKTYSVSLTGKKDTATENKPDTKEEQNNFSLITSVSATDKTISVKTTDKSSPVISKMSNPSRLVLDFYDFTLKNGDGAVGKSGECFSNVRFANHDEYARIVVDITKEYSYELKITKSSCIITLKSEEDEEINDTSEENVPEFNEDKKEEDEEKSEEDDVIFDELPSGNGGSGLVVIDPGHGGSDPGAIGYKDGEIYIRESDINLDISLKLYDILKEKGINVSLTRSTDVYVGLKERAEYANNLDATLFICVHNNSATIDTANGSMVYYFTGPGDEATKKAYGITSKELAELIQKPLLEYGGRYDRKISDGSKFVVMYSTVMPAVLIECAFVSNEEERELLNTEQFRQQLANGIAVGVIEGLIKTGKYTE